MILVTGASGKTGRVVVRALIARDRQVRALIRRPEEGPKLIELGASEVVAVDMLDARTFREAADGAQALYHIPPNVSPHEVQIGRNAIDAAVAAGAEHFVYHSVLHPQTQAMPHHWHKLRVEEALFESGLAVTILQPSAYMQNVLGNWDAITERGIYEVPYRVDARLSLVDLEDVAQAAARVLTEPGHAGSTYELAGPHALSQTEIAQALSRSLGREVVARTISLDEWTQRAGGSLGGYGLETLVAMFRYYDAHGLRGNPRVLEWLLGRRPTDFETFVARFVRPRDNEPA